jgi:hypothetical protein
MRGTTLWLLLLFAALIAISSQAPAGKKNTKVDRVIQKRAKITEAEQEENELDDDDGEDSDGEEESDESDNDSGDDDDDDDESYDDDDSDEGENCEICGIFMFFCDL